MNDLNTKAEAIYCWSVFNKDHFKDKYQCNINNNNINLTRMKRLQDCGKFEVSLAR
jgi:hypothetical protein